MAQRIPPKQAFAMFQNENAILADTREPDEYARMRIPGARLMPMSVIACLPDEEDSDRPVIFFCRSGQRTRAAEATLNARGHKNAYILDGGIMGWKSAGLPVVEEKLFMPIMRQVQLGAGSLVLLFVLLGMLAPPFLWLAALVGVGLMGAGITGFCGLELLLQKMPWNKGKSSCKAY